VTAPLTSLGADSTSGRAADEPRALARRRARRRPNRWRWRAAWSGAVALAVVLAGFVAFYEVEAHPFGPTGRAVVVNVSPGEPTDAVIGQLEDKGIIGNGLVFRLWLLLHGTPTPQPGGYLFHQNQPFSAVKAVLAQPPDVFDVKVVPGLTVAELARQIGALPRRNPQAFALAAAAAAKQSPWIPQGSGELEGFVAPGTYQLLPDESDRALVARMLQRFDRLAAAVDLQAGAAALGLTPYQVVTVASIVQKEGYIADNMSKVARVIYNRLARGMPLQMDSTVLYSLGQDGGPVSPAEEQVNTPYNTYLHTGLPPTPICVPSKAALVAALHPAPGSWLYFTLVSKDGTEQFSDTYAQQLAAEALAASRGLP